jgi:hypothetical protein
MTGVRNSKLSIDFDLTSGITLRSISDVATGREYLRTPSMLFEFAVDNGNPGNSTSLSVSSFAASPDGSSLHVSAISTRNQISFDLLVTLASDSAVAILQLTANNLSGSTIFLRVVLPKIRGVSTPKQLMGVIPKEAGDVILLSKMLESDGSPRCQPDGSSCDLPPANRRPITLGMDFDIDIGLPRARNNMEVASVFDGSEGGGVFFCDVDGDLDNGIRPLQFNLSATEVDGFWIDNIPSNTSTTLPRLAIGVHTTGNWHQAVDYYTSIHRPRWTFQNTPSWFRDAGAIYCPTAVTAGGIYLSLPQANLPDGAIWNTWEDDNGPWRDGANGNKGPVQISPAGFTPAGALLQSIKQTADQVSLFAAGFDGAVWTTWETGNGPWRNNRNGLTPARITPQNIVTPGIPLACGQQGDDQMDVFFVDKDGFVSVTWERGGNAWTDGQDGRPGPLRISRTHTFPPGANLAAVRQNESQLDLFVIGSDGAIWLMWVTDFNAWSDPVRITPPQLFSPGAPLVAVKQNDARLNVFVVDNQGTIQTTWENNDSAWQNQPRAVSPQGFARPRAHLAAAKQSDSQLDVFVVRDDGAIWVTWEVDDGPWTDGLSGRNPVAITQANLAAGGAPLAVAAQGADRLDVFVTGNYGAIWVTWERGNSAWTDGQDGRPGPSPVTPCGFAPPSSGVSAIARSDTHVDVFCSASGRIQSFHDLPKLLSEANALGTNILYLTDYWEGTDEGDDPPFWNKGEYQPRTDLGGRDAFVAGIDAVHGLGGRVLLYLEPFIIYYYSEIAKKHGVGWAGRDGSGNLLRDYPNNYTMVAPFSTWRENVIKIAERLVRDYGADGIFLDSYAWQMNRPMKCNDENRMYSAQEYSVGVYKLAEMVRTAIQKIKPDAVVLGETTAGPIARHWDGGLNADFAASWPFWQPAAELGLTASPVRYGIPEVHMFGNGLDLNGLHQFYAAGHGLALCSYWPGSFMFDFAAHIKTLVQIRHNYSDALIHGAQINQPSTGNPNVVVYQFEGTTHRMITIVNIDTPDVTTSVNLQTPDPGGSWKDLLTDEIFVTQSGVLQNVALMGSEGKGSLRVLLNVHT